MIDCKYNCNGTGLTVLNGKVVPCPIHKKPVEEVVMGVTEVDGKSVEEYLRIPVGVDYWNININSYFNHIGLKYITEESIAQMKTVMTKILTELKDKKSIHEVNYAFYPAMLNLTNFFFTIQKLAIENKISTVPIISVEELYSLIKASESPLIEDAETGKTVRYYKGRDPEIRQGIALETKLGASYTDYYDARLVIIRDTSLSRKESLKKLKGFVEERGYAGNVTYLISSEYIGRDREMLLSNGNNYEDRIRFTPIQLESSRIAEKKEEEGKTTSKKTTKKQVNKNRYKGML